MARKAKKTSGGKSIEKLVLPRIDRREVVIPIAGISPLIVHNWSEKSKRQIREKNQGKARMKKPPVDPQAEFESSLYVIEGREDWPIDKEGRYYFPAKAFKSAIVQGCRAASKDVPMTEARGLLYVLPEPELEFGELAMREDHVRFERTTDLRYRGEFRDWGCDLHIEWNANLITLEQLVNLVNLGGFHVGVGEWRPGAPRSYNGEYGRFEVRGNIQEEL